MKKKWTARNIENFVLLWLIYFCVCVFFMSFLEVGGGGCALNTRNIFANAPTVCPTTHLRIIGHDYPGGKTRYKRDSRKK